MNETFIVFYMSDPSLNVFQSKAAHNKPEFQRTEWFPEANLPVLNNRKKHCYAMININLH